MLTLPSKRPLIMGIINVTPDSFSGDGLWQGHAGVQGQDAMTSILTQAEAMIHDGADLLDIGGESSRPGSAPVSLDEELRRVVPVVVALRKHFPQIQLAVDTVKAQVADQALAAGAVMINDITALHGDAGMAPVVARHQAMIVLMHNSATATAVTRDDTIGGEYQPGSQAKDCVGDVVVALQERIAAARAAGIADHRILLDPGIGFGKSVADNLALIRATAHLRTLGFPLLIGTSRKSFIGRVLNLPVDERVEGTAATVAVAAFLGADILRVHDVKIMARVAKMAAALGQEHS